MKALLRAALAWALFASPAHAEPPSNAPCPAAVSATPAVTTLVDLNTASEAQLLDLPGVGPSRAKAILAFREAHGGFTNVSQLMRIKGFGRSMLQRLRPLVTVSPVH